MTAILFEDFTVTKLDFQLQAKDMKLRKLKDGGFTISCPGCGYSNKFYEGYMTSAIQKPRDVAKTRELLEEVAKAERKGDFLEWLITHAKIRRKFQNEVFTAMKSTTGTIEGTCSRCGKKIRVSVSASVPKKLASIPIPFWKASATISETYAKTSEESFFEVRDTDGPLHLRELEVVGRSLYDRFRRNPDMDFGNNDLVYRINWVRDDIPKPEAAKIFNESLQRYLRQLEWLPKLGRKLQNFWKEIEGEADREDVALPYSLSKMGTQFKNDDFVKTEMKKVRRRILEHLLWLWNEISRHSFE
jgi:hypothetical protein